MGVITLVKPYFRERILSLDSKFQEWTDAFNIENIPSTILDKSYHLAFGTVDGGLLSGKTQQIECNVLVRLFFKGYRNVSENVDRGIDLSEQLIRAVQDPAERLGESIKGVKFLGMEVNEGFASNDNLIVVTQNYSVTLFLCSGG